MEIMKLGKDCYVLKTQKVLQLWYKGNLEGHIQLVGDRCQYIPVPVSKSKRLQKFRDIFQRYITPYGTPFEFVTVDYIRRNFQEFNGVVRDLYDFIYKHCPDDREWLEKNYKEYL